MLVEFSVTNFRSIRETQRLSAVSNAGKELLESNTFLPHEDCPFRLSKAMAIYGPNAAGKSNVIAALGTMRRVVISSTDTQRGTPIPVTPFKLSSELSSRPSEFEIVFITNGIRYQYGFAATNHHVTEEWLFAFPANRKQTLFERTFESASGEYIWSSLSKLSGHKKLWKDSTRENELFLSKAIQLNSVQLQPVFDWFKHTLQVIDIDGTGHGYTMRECIKSDSAQQKVLEFVRAADQSISGLNVTKKQFEVNELPKDVPETLKAYLSESLVGKEVFELTLNHKNSEGKSIALDLDDESDGTKRMIEFSGPWLDVLENGLVLVVDELNKHLHPHLLLYLVQRFFEKPQDTKYPQLVFTTHDTSILQQDVLRRDQIWFVDKDLRNSTFLFPLTDFHPRKKTENVQRNYLEGRYFAVPHLPTKTVAVEQATESYSHELEELREIAERWKGDIAEPHSPKYGRD